MIGVLVDVIGRTMAFIAFESLFIIDIIIGWLAFVHATDTR